MGYEEYLGIKDEEKKKAHRLNVYNNDWIDFNGMCIYDSDNSQQWKQIMRFPKDFQRQVHGDKWALDQEVFELAKKTNKSFENFTRLIFLLNTQCNMCYQVKHLFLRKKKMDFLPLVKLKWHDKFHCVISVTSRTQLHIADIGYEYDNSNTDGSVRAGFCCTK